MICTRTLIFLLFIFCFTAKSHGQTAEKLFGEESTKFSFVLQPSLLRGYELGIGPERVTDKTPGISFNNSFSPQFGFFYNFYQKNNFNFKAGIIAKSFIPTFNLHIPNDILNAGYDYSSGLDHFEMANQFVISETFKTEYFYNITDKLNLVMGLGISLDIRTSGGNDRLTVAVYDYNQETYQTIFSVESDEQQVTGSIDFSLGLNYKTNLGLFQLEFFSNSQLLSYPKQGIYQFHLNQKEPQTGVYTIKGDYIGLAVIFTPAHGWLKKKAKV